MTQAGNDQNPLRVAIIGSGPAGFYAAEYLMKHDKLAFQVDMYDRLPTPFGLVRGGVAPDHQKIKSVTKVYDRIAQDPRFRFYGNVEIGKDINPVELEQYYHALIYTTGAQTDKKLGIPGEELKNSHAATEFVAWYNGHPDYRDLEFDLSQEKVAVIGVGNVAVDVARILSRSIHELEQTDIAEHALEALRHSKVKEVYLIGRRGPAQAAFTTPEIKELGEMEDADILVPPDEAELDEASRTAIVHNPDRGLMRKVEIIQDYAKRQRTGKARALILRFLLSPEAFIGDEQGRVKAIRFMKNRLVATDVGTLRPEPTGETEVLECGLVLVSIGYRGVPIAGLPFHDKWGVIQNEQGRVIDGSGAHKIGYYTAGWIKRGPSGVIGTNKPDAVETVNMLIADMEQGKLLSPAHPDRAALDAFIRQCQPRVVSYDDWLRLDAEETGRGAKLGRPRVKFTRVAEMLDFLGHG